MDTMSYIIGRNSAGGGTGSTPSWSDITNKPFNTIGSGLEVDNGALIFDERELGDYVKTNDLAAVATSGDYDDLSNKPTIPQPTSVSVTQTLQSGTAIADIDVDGVTTTLYAPAAGGSSTQADWAETDSTADSYIQNKPSIYKGTSTDSLMFNHSNNVASGSWSTAFGNGNRAEGMSSVAVGANNVCTNPFAVVEGSNNNQVGDTAHAQGKYKYKWPWRDAAFLENDVADSIGNGTSNSNRSCAEVTTWTGDKFLAGDIYTHVTNWADPRSNSVKLAPVPVAPTTSGTYTLQVVVDSDGNPTYSWI